MASTANNVPALSSQTYTQDVNFYFENSWVGKAGFFMDLEGINYGGGGLLTGVNTMLNKPFEILFQYTSSNFNFPRNSTAYTFCQYNLMIQMTKDFGRVMGRVWFIIFFLISNNSTPLKNHFLSSVKMQLTQIFTIFAVAIASAAAAPGGHGPPPPPPPPPKPTSVVQQITCGGNSNPFCCSPNQADGYTCTGLEFSSVNCNGITICCNNNDGAQDCDGQIGGPITWA